MLDKLYFGFAKTKTAVVIAAAAAYFVLLSLSGGSVAEFSLLGLVLLAYVVLPGFLGVQIFRVNKWMPGWWAPLSFLLGSGFFAVVYCFAMRLGILWLLRLLPPVIGLVWVVLARRRKKAQPRKIYRTRPAPHQWMLILLYAALLLLFAFYFVVKNAHPSAVGNILLNQDLLWNAGNANSFKIAFPPQDIRFVGVRLHYHYFTELLAGALSIVSGIPAYSILAFYLQPYLLAALVLCLFRTGRLLFGKTMWQPLLFTYSLFLFSCASLWKILPNGLSVFWNANIIHLITNVNSQTTATFVLCVFTAIFIKAARQKYKIGFFHFTSILLAFILLVFSKGPTGALLAIAVILTVLVSIPLGQGSVRGVALGVCILGIFAYIYISIFSSGANDSMPFSLSGTLEKGYFYNILFRLQQENLKVWKISIPFFWLLQSFLMMPAQFPLYIRGIAGDIRHFGKLPAEKLLFHAVGAGGLAAFFLFNHPAMSQTYFLYNAIFFINILAVGRAGDLPAVWQKAKQKGGGIRKLWLAFLAAFCAVGVATTAFLYVHMLGSGARQLARNLDIVPTYPYELTMTADDENGMLWLAENSPQNAMFATNRIHTGPRREGISNVYSAFCGRQGFMEGFQYAKTNMGVSADEIIARQTVNNMLFSAETPPEAIPVICAENDISYLVFCTQMDGVDASDTQLTLMDLVWDSPTLRIYALPAEYVF